MGLLDTFNNWQQDTDMESPNNQRTQAWIAALLQAGGPSLKPTSLGQALGGAMQYGQQAYQGAQDRLTQADLRKQQKAVQDLQMKGLGLDIKGKQTAFDQAEKTKQLNIQFAQKRLGLPMPGQNYQNIDDAGINPLTSDQSKMLDGGQRPMNLSFGSDGAGQFTSNNAIAPQQQPQRQAMAQPAAATPMQSPTNKLDLVRQQAQNLMEQADYHDANGGDGTPYRAKAIETLKNAPKFANEPRLVRGPDGKPVLVQMADDGTVIPMQGGYSAAPKIREVNLQDRVQLIDDNSAQPGQTFKMGVSPASAQQNALGWANLNFQKEKSAKEDAPIPQDNVESIAQLIATNRMPPLSRRDITTPTGMAIMKRVSEINNNYSANDISTMGRAEKDFATGKQGNSVRSFNVSLSHLDTLAAAADALQNGNVQMFNRMGNAIAEKTGNPAPTNFEATKKIVADEIVKAIVGAGGALADREAAAETISKTNSPAQLKGVINQYKELMVGQLKGLEGQYQATTGKKDFQDKYLSNEAKNMYAAHNQPAATKTITLSDIAATARASGKSTAEVTAAAKAKGYIIGGN